MNKSRALEILSLKNSLGFLPYSYRGRFGATETEQIHPQGITEPEDRRIREYWHQMSGNSSYHDALVSISKGEELVRYYYVAVKIRGNEILSIDLGDRKELPEKIKTIAISEGIHSERVDRCLRDLIDKWNLNSKTKSEIYWLYSIEKIGVSKAQEFADRMLEKWGEELPEPEKPQSPREMAWIWSKKK